MGLPPWSPSSACVHHHCNWGRHCHRPDKVLLALQCIVDQPIVHRFSVLWSHNSLQPSRIWFYAHTLLLCLTRTTSNVKFEQERRHPLYSSPSFIILLIDQVPSHNDQRTPQGHDEKNDHESSHRWWRHVLSSLPHIFGGRYLFNYHFMVCSSHPSLWILQPVLSFILQVIVMPKMWVLQASVYVFLLLGNSFVVSFNTQSSVMKWNEMMALKNSHHFKELTDQDEMLLIDCI